MCGVVYVLFILKILQLFGSIIKNKKLRKYLKHFAILSINAKQICSDLNILNFQTNCSFVFQFGDSIPKAHQQVRFCPTTLNKSCNAIFLMFDYLFPREEYTIQGCSISLLLSSPSEVLGLCSWSRS